jgi:hypothetical protein
MKHAQMLAAVCGDMPMALIFARLMDEITDLRHRSGVSLDAQEALLGELLTIAADQHGFFDQITLDFDEGTQSGPRHRTDTGVRGQSMFRMYGTLTHTHQDESSKGPTVTMRFCVCPAWDGFSVALDAPTYAEAGFHLNIYVDTRLEDTMNRPLKEALRQWQRNEDFRSRHQNDR